jgi:putative tryptophan/tyrosine transport system substrate-binding protein
LDAGRNLRIEVRYGEGDEAAIRKHAGELVALAPDVLVAGGGAVLEVVLKITHTIPIVFVIVPDPVGSGFVESLSKPGANATGFMMFEYNLCGKWLELLKEIAPSLTHAAVLRDPGTAAGIGQFAIIQSVAPSVGVDVIPVNLSCLRSTKNAIMLPPDRESRVHLQHFGRTSKPGDHRDVAYEIEIEIGVERRVYCVGRDGSEQCVAIR